MLAYSASSEALLGCRFLFFLPWWRLVLPPLLDHAPLYGSSCFSLPFLRVLSNPRFSFRGISQPEPLVFSSRLSGFLGRPSGSSPPDPRGLLGLSLGFSRPDPRIFTTRPSDCSLPDSGFSRPGPPVFLSPSLRVSSARLFFWGLLSCCLAFGVPASSLLLLISIFPKLTLDVSLLIKILLALSFPLKIKFHL